MRRLASLCETLHCWLLVVGADVVAGVVVGGFVDAWFDDVRWNKKK